MNGTVQVVRLINSWAEEVNKSLEQVAALDTSNRESFRPGDSSVYLAHPDVIEHHKEDQLRKEVEKKENRKSRNRRSTTLKNVNWNARKKGRDTKSKKGTVKEKCSAWYFKIQECETCFICFTFA